MTTGDGERSYTSLARYQREGANGGRPTNAQLSGGRAVACRKPPTAGDVEAATVVRREVGLVEWLNGGGMTLDWWPVEELR